VDLAGFPKDRFWLYKSPWRPDASFVHLVPHWTWPGREGQFTPVHAFTSGDEAELFVNGVSQGRQKRAAFQYRFRWDYVRYEPGEIRIVVWKDGNPWAEQRVRTAGPPVRIIAQADRSMIAGDGKDLSFVSVELRDASGTPVLTDNRPMRFSIVGPGEIVATDNGDPTDFTVFSSSARKLFNGRALAIVRAAPGRKGSATLRVEADGLPASTVRIDLR
jgi:beta-galactosidase